MIEMHMKVNYALIVTTYYIDDLKCVNLFNILKQGILLEQAHGFGSHLATPP